jgi:hypothetical protein
MKTIQLMADYQCFPLWEASAGPVGNIDPRNLPISNDLKARLLRCASDFDATLNLADPARSGFQSEEAKTEVKRAGIELGKRLQSELGADYVVKIKV